MFYILIVFLLGNIALAMDDKEEDLLEKHSSPPLLVKTSEDPPVAVETVPQKTPLKQAIDSLEQYLLHTEVEYQYRNCSTSLSNEPFAEKRRVELHRKLSEYLEGSIFVKEVLGIINQISLLDGYNPKSNAALNIFQHHLEKIDKHLKIKREKDKEFLRMMGFQ